MESLRGHRGEPDARFDKSGRWKLAATRSSPGMFPAGAASGDSLAARPIAWASRGDWAHGSNPRLMLEVIHDRRDPAPCDGVSTPADRTIPRQSWQSSTVWGSLGIGDASRITLVSFRFFRASGEGSFVCVLWRAQRWEGCKGSEKARELRKQCPNGPSDFTSVPTNRVMRPATRRTAHEPDRCDGRRDLRPGVLHTSGPIIRVRDESADLHSQR